MPVTQTRSVRFRVTALATLIVAGVLWATALALVLTQQRLLTSALDDGLRLRADDLAVLVANTIPDSLPGAGDDSAAQIVTAGGEVVAYSANLAGGESLAPDPGGVDVVAERQIEALDDSFRVLSRSVAEGDDRLIIHVAAATDDVSDSVEVLRTSLLFVVPAAVLVLAVMIWWLVGHALRPVDDITQEVKAISERDLDLRVTVPPTGDEISRLAETMNGMLDRLEDGVGRLQRFAADASHELRSPLTRIRSELEVDLANAGTSDMVETHRSVLEETVALQELVDDLLLLARTEADGQLPRRRAVDLDDLVIAEAERLRSSTTLEIDVSGVSGAQIMGDAAHLTRAIQNLGANAASHARNIVTLELRESDDFAELAVGDDGPGIPPAESERVFERFARLDEARSRDGGGSGLGLAIVRDVVERHGGAVTVDRSCSEGARLVVRLPIGDIASDHTKNGADDGDDNRAQNRRPEVVDG